MTLEGFKPTTSITKYFPAYHEISKEKAFKMLALMRLKATSLSKIFAAYKMSNGKASKIQALI